MNRTYEKASREEKKLAREIADMVVDASDDMSDAMQILSVVKAMVVDELKSPKTGTAEHVADVLAQDSYDYDYEEDYEDIDDDDDDWD